MLKDRFCNESGQVDWTLEDVRKVVSQSNWEEEELAEDLVELTLNRPIKRLPDLAAKQAKAKPPIPIICHRAPSASPTRAAGRGTGTFRGLSCPPLDVLERIAEGE